MRTIIPLIIVVCLLLYGCNGKCDGYAPENLEISWTDYNPLRKVSRYYGYYNTGRLHSRDTVRLYGYIMGFGDTNYYRSAYENPDCAYSGCCYVTVFITDNPEKTFAKDKGLSLPMYDVVENMEWLLDYHAKQKVYVTCFCEPVDPLWDACSWLVNITKVINVIID